MMMKNGFSSVLQLIHDAMEGKKLAIKIHSIYDSYELVARKYKIPDCWIIFHISESFQCCALGIINEINVESKP